MPKRQKSIDCPQLYPNLTILRLLLVLVYCASLGWWYNRQVDEIAEKGNAWPNRALLVAAGVTLTLWPQILLMGWKTWAITMAMFIASGFEMIRGSARRINEAINITDILQANLDEALDQLIEIWQK